MEQQIYSPKIVVGKKSPETGNASCIYESQVISSIGILWLWGDRGEASGPLIFIRQRKKRFYAPHLLYQDNMW